MEDKDRSVPICIYHGGCLDGFMSAYIAWEAFDERIDLWPGKYEEPPPLDVLRGREVVIVDFSYKRGPMEEIHKVAHSVLVLDHHKTAKQELEPWLQSWPDRTPVFPTQGYCYAYFDMERSGCGMTWDFFFPQRKRPLLVDAVEDRDLWRFEKPFTREVNAALYSMPFEVDNFRELMSACHTSKTELHRLIDQGMAIMRSDAKNRKAIIEHGVHEELLGGHLMPVVNAPWWMASEIGNDLAREHSSKCAATYFVDKDNFKSYSIRSVEGGPDVSQIAAQYGGGGHQHAAGFRVKL